MCSKRNCKRVCEPTGGLRPPLLYCVANVSRRKNDFFDAQTHIHKSGGRQPAVGVSIALAMKDGFVVSDDRRYQERRASARRGEHCAGKIANADRRPSGRRGSVTHLQEQAFLTGGGHSRTTAGLRQPLQFAPANVVIRIPCSTADRIALQPTAGLRQPLLEDDVRAVRNTRSANITASSRERPGEKREATPCGVRGGPTTRPGWFFFVVQYQRHVHGEKRPSA